MSECSVECKLRVHDELKNQVSVGLLEFQAVPVKLECVLFTSDPFFVLHRPASLTQHGPILNSILLHPNT